MTDDIMIAVTMFMAILSATMMLTGCQKPPIVGTQDNAPTTPESQEPTCQKGFVNDPYPGMCNSYVDKNNNGVCDYSEIGE